MSYTVKTIKSYPDGIPANTEVFTTGPIRDKWDEMIAAGKIISYEETPVSNTAVEETIVFDTRESAYDFGSLFAARDTGDVDISVFQAA